MYVCLSYGLFFRSIWRLSAHSTLCLSLALRPLVRSYNRRWVSQSEWTFWIATTPKKQRGPALCRPPLILRSRRNLDGASNNEGWSWQSTRDSWVCPRKPQTGTTFCLSFRLLFLVSCVSLHNPRERNLVAVNRFKVDGGGREREMNGTVGFSVLYAVWKFRGFVVAGIFNPPAGLTIWILFLQDVCTGCI